MKLKPHFSDQLMSRNVDTLTCVPLLSYLINMSNTNKIDLNVFDCSSPCELSFCSFTLLLAPEVSPPISLSIKPSSL